MNGVELRFVINSSFITKSYPLKDFLNYIEVDILEDAEECIDPSCLHQGFCECTPRFENSKITHALRSTEKFDKNGVELWEGDIINYLNDEGIDSVVAIEFKDCGLYPFAPDYLHNSQVKVIGNIYENPELLKEPKLENTE